MGNFKCSKTLSQAGPKEIRVSFLPGMVMHLVKLNFLEEVMVLL